MSRKASSWRNKSLKVGAFDAVYSKGFRFSSLTLGEGEYDEKLRLLSDEEFEAWLDEVDWKKQLELIDKNRERRKIIQAACAERLKVCEMIKELRDTLDAKKMQVEERHAAGKNKWNASLQRLLENYRPTQPPAPLMKENVPPLLQRVSEEQQRYEEDITMEDA